MKNTAIKTKEMYRTPQITPILLDNEISLQLESTPPVGPDEIGKISQEYFKEDCFKTINA